MDLYMMQFLFYYIIELCPSLHLGVVAIGEGAFWSPSTTVANLFYFYIR